MSSYGGTNGCLTLPHIVSVKVLRSDSTISKLLDEETKEWKRALVDEIFNKEEAIQIISIPRSRLGAEDKLIWEFTKDGRFIVRSAYHLAQGIRRQKVGETSREREMEDKWKKLWGLNIPSVAKHFIQRSRNDLLQTRYNLCIIKMIDYETSPICLNEAETVSHILWSCPAAFDAWGGGERGSSLQKWSSYGENFLTLWKVLCRVLKKDQLEVTVVIMRSIRHRRNLL